MASDDVDEMLRVPEREDREIEQGVALARIGPVDDASDLVPVHEYMGDLQIAVREHGVPRSQGTFGEPVVALDHLPWKDRVGDEPPALCLEVRCELVEAPAWPRRQRRVMQIPGSGTGSGPRRCRRGRRLTEATKRRPVERRERQDGRLAPQDCRSGYRRHPHRLDLDVRACLVSIDLQEHVTHAQRRTLTMSDNDLDLDLGHLVIITGGTGASPAGNPGTHRAQRAQNGGSLTDLPPVMRTVCATIRRVRVRRFEARDARPVWALNALPNIGFTADPSIPLELPLPEEPPANFLDLANVEARFIDVGGDFLVVESEGYIVGMGGIRPSGDRRAEVLRVRVHPATRRQGVGRILMQALEARAADLGIRELHLDTATNQPEAVAFYEGIGYERTGEETRAGWSWTLVYFVKHLIA